MFVRLLSVIALVAALSAQDTDTVLRVTSRLVQISVIAQDKNGNPVRDLTKDDFVLTDYKEPQPISIFSLEAAEPNSAPPEPAEKPGPLTITNRGVHANSRPMAVTVILFDALNIGSDDLQYGKNAVVRFLRTLHPGDPVAVYSIRGPQVRVVHDFTEDTASLIAAANNLSGTRVLGGSTPIGSGADDRAPTRLKAEWTLTALEVVARHLNGVPGRKNMIWISSGIPMNIGLDPALFNAARQAGVDQQLEDYGSRLHRIARILAEANVAVYPIDPAGVRTDPLKTALQIGNEQFSGHMVTAGGASAPQLETMRTIAALTGGLAYFNNDIEGNIRRATDDARITYTLGFYPAQQSWDGKFHDLQVIVKRPGVQVRTRSGYFAASVAELRPEREQSLKLAVASPLEGAAIGIKVNVQSNPLQFYGQEMTVEIDPRDLLFEQKQGRMRANVDAVFAQLSKNGRLVRGEKKTVIFNLTPESYDDALATGVFLTEQITIERNTSRVRVVLQDASTGAVGSVSIPVRGTGLN